MFYLFTTIDPFSHTILLQPNNIYIACRWNFCFLFCSSDMRCIFCGCHKYTTISAPPPIHLTPTNSSQRYSAHTMLSFEEENNDAAVSSANPHVACTCHSAPPSPQIFLFLTWQFMLQIYLVHTYTHLVASL